MKTGVFLLFLFLFCSNAKAQDVITITKTTSRTYTGSVGQKSVRLNLSIADNKASGEYAYQGSETPLELTGGLEDNRLNLTVTPASNFTSGENADNYFSKGTLTGIMDASGNISGTFHTDGNASGYDIHLNKIFEVTYVDTALKAAYINHNPDFKVDTVYTLSLQELHFLNLPYRAKLRSLKNWYSFPLVSVVEKGGYQDLNGVGNVRLEELGYIDGDYLLKQRKTISHAQYPYHFRGSYSVAYIDNRFLSVKTDRYIFDGSPHAFKNQTYKSYDLQTGDSLKLDSLFLRGGKYYLDSVGEIYFRKQVGLSPDIDLATAGYYWNDSFFHVSSNFYFTVSGICFVYNAYEIASYNMGSIKFIIPYEMLKPIIRRKGPLGWVRNE